MPKTIADIAEALRDIDFAMLNTHSRGGAIAARPMSNNRQVNWDGTSHYFSMGDTLTVEDIGRDPKVGLSFQGKAGMLGMRPFFVAVEGTADLVRDHAAFQEHWSPDLDRWFPQGIETPGLVMIRVRAERVHYWDGEEEGELTM